MGCHKAPPTGCVGMCARGASLSDHACARVCEETLPLYLLKNAVSNRGSARAPTTHGCLLAEFSLEDFILLHRAPVALRLVLHSLLPSHLRPGRVVSGADRARAPRALRTAARVAF